MNKVARSPLAIPFRRSTNSRGMTNVSAAPENVWRGGRGRSVGSASSGGAPASPDHATTRAIHSSQGCGPLAIATGRSRRIGLQRLDYGGIRFSAVSVRIRVKSANSRINTPARPSIGRDMMAGQDQHVVVRIELDSNGRNIGSRVRSNGRLDRLVPRLRARLRSDSVALHRSHPTPRSRLHQAARLFASARRPRYSGRRSAKWRGGRQSRSAPVRRRFDRAGHGCDTRCIGYCVRAIFQLGEQPEPALRRRDRQIADGRRRDNRVARIEAVLAAAIDQPGQVPRPSDARRTRELIPARRWRREFAR